MSFDDSPFVIGQRIDVEVPLLRTKSRSARIAYSATVTRVERQVAGVLIACRSVRAKLRRVPSGELPAYTM